MFAFWPSAGQRLPRGVWEPLRKLNDTHGVSLEVLAEVFGVERRVMLEALHAARIARGRAGGWLPDWGGPDADAVPARC